VERVIGQRSDDLRRRQQPQPERPRRRLAPAGDDPAIRPARLGARDLLLEDRRDQRLEDRPAAADPEARAAAVEIKEEAVVGRKS
jgi:hypothetical protein